VAQNPGRRGGSAIDNRTTLHQGYAISQKKRKRIEEWFSWLRKIQPAFTKVGITGVGWHTFRHTVGTMLAEMGEHQLTIRDYLRHNLHVTNKYLQATRESKRLAQGKLVDAILPSGLLSVNKSTLIQ
jgi:integrase